MKRSEVLADSLRQMNMIFSKVTKHHKDLAEHRYEEYAGEYKLRTWNNGHETSSEGLLETRPEWLVNIINISRIGAHAKQVSTPPPDIIVWFRTDSGGTALHSFVDFVGDTQ